MKIAILDDYQNCVRQLACFRLLEGHDVRILNETIKEPALLAAKLTGVEIIVPIRERTVINEALLSQLPDLKLISQTGKISNHLDLAACTRCNVAVAEGVGSPVAPAELAWALLMNALRQMPEAIGKMKEGRWQVNMGTTVKGKTIGIWGYGKIGRLVAQYAKAFGADVLVWGSPASRDQAEQDGFRRAESKEAFFETADVVTLHLRLTGSTVGIVRQEDLQRMKPTAVFVNTARAELVEKDALITALKSGRPGFAAVDVYEEEPIYNPAYELLAMPNVICTPHIGYVEQNGYELYFNAAFENIVSYLKGTPRNIANPEVLADLPSGN